MIRGSLTLRKLVFVTRHALQLEHAHVGISWMEMVLSFIPLRRASATGDSQYAWARSLAEAIAFGYSWNECAIQFASIVGQAISSL